MKHLMPEPVFGKIKALPRRNRIIGMVTGIGVMIGSFVNAFYQNHQATKIAEQTLEIKRINEVDEYLAELKNRYVIGEKLDVKVLQYERDSLNSLTKVVEARENIEEIRWRIYYSIPLAISSGFLGAGAALALYEEKKKAPKIKLRN